MRELVLEHDDDHDRAARAPAFAEHTREIVPVHEAHRARESQRAGHDVAGA